MMEKVNPHIPQWVIIVCLLFFNFILYANTLFNGFVSDDIAAIVQNPDIGRTSVYINPFDPQPSQILNSLIYNIVGLSPWLYHLNNLIWHILNTLLVFALINWLGAGVLFATLTSSLFAIHPIHTEPVNWISGLPYLLYSCFSLMTLFLVVGVDRRKLKKWWLFLIPITATLAFVSSEKSLVLPLIVLILSKRSYILFSAADGSSDISSVSS